MNLKPYLEDIERRICPEDEQALEKAWLTFADGQCPHDVFAPSRPARPAGIDWPMMYVNDAFEDEERMVYHQLRLVSEELSGGHGNLLNVRANYGTGIIPSMFGAEMFYLDRETDTLPCTRPLSGGTSAIERVVKERRTDYGAGLAAKVFRFAQVYAEAIAPYPKITRFVRAYNPDLQGPFPLADAMWGGEIYYALADEDDLVLDMLDFMTDVYIDFTRRWQCLFPPYDGAHSVEWGLLHRGHTIVRNDAAMNISGNMYQTFVMPRDQRVLTELGGGIHFCGRGDHYIGHVGALAQIGCVNLSQPELNDMEMIYAQTIDRGIPIVGMPAAEVERAIKANRPLHGLVHCGASLAAWDSKK